MTTTKLEREALHAAILATERGEWHRATGQGQRVSLASMYRKGFLVRRAWRGTEGERDAAHEYQATADVLAAWRAGVPA